MYDSVDSSPNSLVESVTKTKRQEVYNIEPMTHDMIQCIPKCTLSERLLETDVRSECKQTSQVLL